MRIVIAIIAMASVIGCAKSTDILSKSESLNRTRACIPASGHSTQLDVSSSAGTGALDEYKVYGFICSGSSGVYFELGDTEAATADSNSNYLPDDTWLWILTGGGNQSRYLSAVDTAAAAGTCYVMACE